MAEDNLTWIKGKHSLKFGGKVRFEYDNIRELQQAQGSHNFNPTWTALYDPVNDRANAVYRRWSGRHGPGTVFGRQKPIQPRLLLLRAARDWVSTFTTTGKSLRRLTLDLGVRWDNWRPYQEKYNRLVNVDLATSPIVLRSSHPRTFVSKTCPEFLQACSTRTEHED